MTSSRSDVGRRHHLQNQNPGVAAQAEATLDEGRRQQAQASDRPPIPDAPLLPKWFKGYARYGDEFVILMAHGPDASAESPYAVASGPRICGCPSDAPFSACPEGGGHWYRRAYQGNDHAEALAEYHRQAALLCDGGGEGVA